MKAEVEDGASETSHERIDGVERVEVDGVH
jgi:hypothetical protein